jgi:hypothetical protein
VIKALNQGVWSRILYETNLAMKIKWKGNYWSRLDAMAKWKAQPKYFDYYGQVSKRE